ncbi:class II aldolase/adducin family protein [bacterium]|nr:class II aldolase/adducin family protein [bacterium]
MDEKAKRSQIVAIARRMYDKGYVVATDGNISVRLSPDRLLLTPTGICKGDLTEDHLIICDNDGNVRVTQVSLPANGGNALEASRLTSETPMHLEVYKRRPDVNAVIHAHPPYTLALNLTGIRLDEYLLPEQSMTLGEVPVAPFAMPSTSQGAEAIRELIEKHDTIILDRHGVLTVGETLAEAFYRLERLEFIAKVTALAHSIGKPK